MKIVGNNSNILKDCNIESLNYAICESMDVNIKVDGDHTNVHTDTVLWYIISRINTYKHKIQ